MKVAALRLEQKPGVILAYMKGLPRAAAPGTVWNYNTGETFIAGAVVEGAVHEPLARILTDTICVSPGHGNKMRPGGWNVTGNQTACLRAPLYCDGKSAVSVGLSVRSGTDS